MKYLCHLFKADGVTKSLIHSGKSEGPAIGTAANAITVANFLGVECSAVVIEEKKDGTTTEMYRVRTKGVDFGKRGQI